MARITLSICLAGALLVPAAASAANYPPPGNPGTIKHHPNGKHVTFKVCKHGRNRVRTIQKAIDFAAPGDTIKVCDGTYRGGVSIEGKGKARLRLIGDVKHPKRVLIELKGAKGAKAQNGVIINGADGVTIRGFWARHYKGNGFFAVNVTGYDLSHLVASAGGTYGIYAFNSKGGTMTDDLAYYNNDSGFYIGQTPPQTKPIRSTVSNVTSWGNVLGFSGTNMRYVTIKNSTWFNNGLGIVPNALSSEKFAPPTDNVITGNDVFWNNFNYYYRAPFKLKKGATGDLGYPIGTGILLFGSKRTTITKNRVSGNYLAGIGMIPQVLLGGNASVLVSDQIIRNDYGRNGTDPNGHDVAYDGSGRNNCVDEGATADDVGSNFPGCPFTGANTPDNAALATMLTWSADPSFTKDARNREKYWVRHTHPARTGITPLQRCTVVKDGCKGQPKG